MCVIVKACTGNVNISGRSVRRESEPGAEHTESTGGSKSRKDTSGDMSIISSLYNLQ